MTEKMNLKKLALESENFAEFHKKTHPANRLHREDQPADKFTKQTPAKPKNLKAIARDATTFLEYRDKAHEGE